MQENPADRAVQFAPFDALAGYREMIDALNIRPEPRRELSEEAAQELSARLAQLREGQQIRVKYYSDADRRYRTVLGTVREADFVFRTVAVGRLRIPFDDIAALRLPAPAGENPARQ